MKFAGIDLGSRTTKIVVVDKDGRVLERREGDTTFDALPQAARLLEDLSFDRIQATGYGRHLFASAHDAPTVSEILAHAAGASTLAPQAQAVLDIGGQDTKAIALGPGGKVLRFEMNDRCAAGTGKFLEVMARAFGLDLGEFGAYAAAGVNPATISSMCTVFAESEAVSLMARGEEPSSIALGLHLAIAKRAAALMRRVGKGVPIAFTGGVARNPCMRDLVGKEFSDQVIVPDGPQFAGALGAALLLRNCASR